MAVDGMDLAKRSRSQEVAMNSDRVILSGHPKGERENTAGKTNDDERERWPDVKQSAEWVRWIAWTSTASSAVGKNPIAEEYAWHGWITAASTGRWTSLGERLGIATSYWWLLNKRLMFNVFLESVARPS
ncbi:unnamed protein product [Heligmosomoides polygyrus]|uniref:Uncharacterized protein n=1 Tax=Heligmosomoides polygyrus TaxID=6339 RepID=A0A183FFP0_HELPZ|nr:unnamed protein product [Heligmosomoides polygyrus]